MSQLVFQGSSAGYLTGSAGSLAIGYRSVAGVAACYLAGTVAALRVAQPVRGSAVGALTASARLGCQVALSAVRGLLTLSSSARLRLPTTGLTVWDAVLDVYGLFKIEVKSPLALDLARNRILGALNSIMQQIWSRAARLNYFNSELITVTVADAATTVELPVTVQSVIGPVSKTGGKDLMPIPSSEALRSFVDYWHGGTAPSYQPNAYYLDCDEDLTQGDRTKITLTLPWAASGNYDLEMLVVKSVPRYTETDIRNATPIRLPAKYVELLFLPLLREWASTDHLFKTEAARPGIAAAANAAKEALGMIEPSQSVTKKFNAEGVTP